MMENKNEFQTIAEIEEEICESLQDKVAELNVIIERAVTHDIGVCFTVNNKTKRNDKVQRHILVLNMYKHMGTTQEEDPHET